MRAQTGEKRNECQVAAGPQEGVGVDSLYRHPIRIVIVDDHRMVLEMMQARLQGVSGLEVVGTAVDGPTALNQIAVRHPDVLLLDLQLPGMTGAEVAKNVLSDHPKVSILVVTGLAATCDPRPLLELGVRGYITKTASLDSLIDAIRSVAQGRTVVVTEVFPRGESGCGKRLTDRKQTVLQLLALGHRTAEISESLSVSARTVEIHVAALRTKLDARSRAELIFKAHQLNLFSPPTT